MSTTPTSVAQRCRACAAPLAADQRYCLECGEPGPRARRPLPAALRPPATPAAAAGLPASRLAGVTPASGLAGVACLLLAIGIGVLIGRSGGGEQVAAAPITISGAAASAAANGATPSAAAPVAFHSDWPARRDGWTIALQALPKATTDAAAVASATAGATRRGAAAVGALDSDAHRSLTAGSYVVYSGVFGSRAAARTALARLRKTFAGARVVRVTNAAAPTARRARSTAPKRATSGKRTTAGSGTGSAFEKSKKLPKTLGTGGKPPPKDDKPAAAGGGFEEIK